jgi:hypothetical protein
MLPRLLRARLPRLLLSFAMLAPAVMLGQIIEFESKGLHYESLTRGGVTVMFAPLPPHVKDFTILQVAVTNGSLVTWVVKPEDFSFVRQDGAQFLPSSADTVVSSLLARASKADVIKLQLLYENTIYALTNFRATNGYEKRREAAMAMFVNPRFRAAAAASAISFAPTKLKPGESTDGAVFFPTHDKTLGAGHLIAHIAGETFDFEILPEVKVK